MDDASGAGCIGWGVGAQSRNGARSSSSGTSTRPEWGEVHSVATPATDPRNVDCGEHALRAAMETAQMTYRSEPSLSHSSPVMFLFLFAPPHRPLQNSITYSTYYFLHSPSCFSLHYFGACFLFTGRFAKTHFFPCIRSKVVGVCTCVPPTSTPSSKPLPVPQGWQQPATAYQQSLLLASFNIPFLIPLSKKTERCKGDESNLILHYGKYSTFPTHSLFNTFLSLLFSIPNEIEFQCKINM